MIGRPPVAPELRFFDYVSQDGDCWLWTGGTARGYGMFWDGRRRIKAHRWIYIHMRDEIPAGLEIDHLCRRKRCVNPWHMEPVTGRVNKLRSESPAARSARRSHCATHGTPLIPVGDRRICRPCRREVERRYRDRQKELQPA